jgi:hypothetical protein
VEAPVVSSQQKFKMQASAGKIMLTIFLGYQWPYIGALPGKGSNCD